MAETQLFQETRGGARHGAGRKTKEQTLAKQAERSRIRDKLTQEGETPLEIIVGYMLQYAKMGKAPESIHCAQLAAPYIHPRLAAVAVQTTKTDLTLEELILESFKPQPKTIESEKIKTITMVDSFEDLL